MSRAANAIGCVALAVYGGCVGRPRAIPPAPVEIEPLDGVWIAPLSKGPVAVFELPLPPCFGTGDQDADASASILVQTALAPVEFRADTLKGVVGPSIVLPAEGPLMPRLRREGRLFFGWVAGSIGSQIEIAGRCDNRTAFVTKMPVESVPLPELRLPFVCRRWKAFYGPSATSAHRRAAIKFEGASRTIGMERFGIDWARIEDEVRMDAKDKDNRAYLSYGTPVVAVADGVTTATHDGIPENETGPTSRAVPITEQTIGGNFVALKIAGADAVAFYAHLQPRSIRVNVGDRVHAGDVLGLLGNSGNSTSPHLHFHVAHVPSEQANSMGVFAPLRASSMPYRERKLGIIDAGSCTLREGILPAEDDIVDAAACASP